MGSAICFNKQWEYNLPNRPVDNKCNLFGLRATGLPDQGHLGLGAIDSVKMMFGFSVALILITFVEWMQGS